MVVFAILAVYLALLGLVLTFRRGASAFSRIIGITLTALAADALVLIVVGYHYAYDCWGSDCGPVLPVAERLFNVFGLALLFLLFVSLIRWAYQRREAHDAPGNGSERLV